MNSFFQRGQAAIHTKNFEEAAGWFEKAAAANPTDPNSIASLGQTLCWLNKRHEGLEHLYKAGQILLKKARKTKDIQLLLMLIQQLHFWGDFEGALVLLKKAVQINKHFFGGHELMAISYARLNNNKLALIAGKNALARNPEHIPMNILQATIESGLGQHQQGKTRLVKLLQKTGLDPEQKFKAHKELAKILDKMDDYKAAFAQLQMSTVAAQNVALIQQQNLTQLPDIILANTQGFDHDLLLRWPAENFNDQRPAPIFLIGFLRSGTTLTQEVLGAHPNVFVTDETSPIPDVLDKLKSMSPNQMTTPDRLRNINLQDAKELRQYYWDKIVDHYGDIPKHQQILDKATLNILDLGLINCIFPDARVIFVMRDPRDVCLSCFMQMFKPTPVTAHLVEWHHTAEFYALVMQWWQTIKQKMSLQFLEIRYEDAIEDFETTYRSIFAFLSIPWDPAVLDYQQHMAGKFIASPSYSQVAQPLYKTSVARWKAYEAEFEPINGKLQPFISAFNYD